MGFHLEEIHWDPVRFPQQKAFLLRAIDTALAGHRWSELCYEPAHANLHLKHYREIVEKFELSPGARPTGRYGWPGPDDAEVRCPRHRVHCSDLGWCRVCLDCGTDTHPGTPGGDRPDPSTGP